MRWRLVLSNRLRFEPSSDCKIFLVRDVYQERIPKHPVSASSLAQVAERWQ